MFPTTVPVLRSSHDPSTARPALMFVSGRKRPAAPVGMTNWVGRGPYGTTEVVP